MGQFFWEHILTCHKLIKRIKSRSLDVNLTFIDLVSDIYLIHLYWHLIITFLYNSNSSKIDAICWWKIHWVQIQRVTSSTTPQYCVLLRCTETYYFLHLPMGDLTIIAFTNQFNFSKRYSWCQKSANFTLRNCSLYFFMSVILSSGK